MITYGNMCAHDANCCKTYGICGPSVKTPSVPTPSGRRLEETPRRGSLVHQQTKNVQTKIC